MDYLYIGKIVDTHGIKGELRIRSNFDYIDKAFKNGMNFYIGETKIKEKVVGYRHHKEFEMVTFEKYDNINQVLKYLKQDVYVLKDDLKLENDEYVLEELVGLDIVEDGVILGKVREIVYNGSNNLLDVLGIEKDFYIPSNGHFIKNVDLENKKIFVENAKGLIL